MFKKRAAIFLGMALAVASIAAVSGAFVANQTIARIGGFVTSTQAFDSLTGGMTGGFVRFAIVGGSTDTLLVGDVVYWSDTNKVTKSATLSLYNAIAGVVVGGIRSSPPMSAAMNSSDVGTVVATTGQRVVILKQGRTWMRSGNNAVLIAGRRVVPSDSVAGRFDSLLTASVIDTFYRFIGRTVTATPAVGVGLVEVSIK